MSKLMRYRQVGVLGYGCYVPVGRISVEEVGEEQGKDGKRMGEALGIKSKAVAERDEDAFTLAWEASSKAVKMAGVKPSEMGGVYVGSESHPYVVKPTATMLGEVLGLGREYVASDLAFACKAGVGGVLAVAAQVEARLIGSGLAVGADVAQSKPDDILECTAGAGAGAVVLGQPSSTASRRFGGAVVRLVASYSFNSDTPDFWRRAGQKHPSHGGRFTGEPGYFAHVVGSVREFLKLVKMEVGEFDQVVLHMPNGKFPRKAAKMLGISAKQMEKGFVVGEIGNPYTASTLIGLCRVLDTAKVGDKILVVSYGSGAGSDCLMFVKEKYKDKVAV